MSPDQPIIPYSIIFLHIPKTAGTTLYRIMDRHYQKKSIYTIWQDGTLDEFKQLNEARRSHIRLLRGHFGLGLDELLRGPTAYFTFLREPIERVISYYHYVRRSPGHYCYEQVTSRRMSLKEFVESRLDPMVDNAQTRLLSGLATGQEIPFGQCPPDLLERARQNLHDRMTVIGLTEKFDQTLLLLKQTFGWNKLLYAPQNVSTDAGGRSAVEGAARDVILAVNQLDVELYRYAQTLFDEQVKRQGPAFSRELEAFQKTNRRLKPFLYLYWELPHWSLRQAVKKRVRR
jgi:hypothetical protein